VFAEWNLTDELNSFLIEITADIFTNLDAETGKPLVELIVDAAGQKGTGRWTVINALEMGVAIPTITAAVNARILSSIKEERVAASKQLSGPRQRFDGDAKATINKIRDALYCSKICSYAQGMALIGKASQTYDYGIDLGETARIWKGGCIIRAGFLNKIKHAYDENPSLANLLLAPEFKQTILDRQKPGERWYPWRQIWVFRFRPLAHRWITSTATAAIACPKT
jgi:6-phosphogluconate dehydrogenase